jgi:hypothetical protein
MKKILSTMLVFLMLFLVTSSVVLGLTEQTTEDVTVSKTESVVKNAAESVTKAFSEEEDKVAVLFGMYDYPGTDSDLEGPPNDVAAMQDVLEEEGYSVYVYENASESTAISAMETQFAGAGEEDTLLFYYSGHGGVSGEESVLWFTDSVSYAGMTVTELQSTLDEYPSTKVVLLDSCYSGGFVNRSITTEDELDEATEEFNENVINIFETADSNISRYVNTSTYKVITACAGDEYSWEGTLEGEKRGYFTYYYTKGCGYFNSYNVLPADDNTNTEITQTEIFNYTYDNIISIQFLSGGQYYTQTVKTYPYESGDPDFVMFKGDAVNVTLETNGHGSISEGSTYTLLEGNNLTITPIPDSGYYTKSVISENGNTVTDNGDGTWTIENITVDDTVTVTFDATAEVIVAISGSGNIAEGLYHTILDGGNLTITPDADIGWYVKSVISANGNTVTHNGDGTYTIENITSEDIVTVIFETTAEVSITVTGNGSITEGTTHTVLDGGDLIITLVAENGYGVQSVVSANGNTVTENGDGTYTIENIASDDTVTVTFTEIEAVYISINGNGSITEGCSYTIFYGENLNITPVPDSGYYVKSVVSANDNTVTDNGDGTYTIDNIIADDTVTVTFDTIAEVTVAVSGNGCISEGNIHTVLDGGDLIITPVPETGNDVQSVVSANGNIVTENGDGTYTIENITLDDTVTVNFSETELVNISINGNGSIIEGTTHIVFHGEDLKIKPDADNGWYVKSVVSVNGNTVTENGDGTYTIENITSDDTVTVTFETTADVLIHISGNGNIEEGLSHTVLDGGDLTITPVPVIGNAVQSVVSANGNTVTDNGDGTYTIENIIADDTATVTFIETESVNISINGDGSITEGTSYTVFMGGDLTITPVADTGWYVKSVVSINGNTIINNGDGTWTIENITVDGTVTVVFDTIAEVIVVVSGNGNISEGTSHSVLDGGNLTITPVADTGWYVKEVVSTNGNTVTNNGDGTWTIENITANDTVTVTFKEKANIYSATVDKESAETGSYFTFTIETNANTDKLAFYSEGVYHSQLTTASSGVTKTVNGDTATWTYTIKVGKTGDRTFSFKAHNSVGWSHMADVNFTVTEPQPPEISSVIVDKVSAVSGSIFTFTIETDADTDRIAFYSEGVYHSQLTTASSGVTKTVNGDTAIWTYAIKVGKTGERTFGFKTHNSIGWSEMHGVSFTVTEPQLPEITDGTVNPVDGEKGSHYTFTIETGADVNYLNFYADSGEITYKYIRQLTTSTSGVTRTVDGDTATWTYVIKIGTTGERIFSFKAHNSAGISNYYPINFTVNELTKPVIDSVTVDKVEGNAGETYTFEITTNESVDCLALYTNTSTKDYRYIRRLYKTTSGVNVKINNDGTATWTYKIKIGSTGDRMFSFKAHNSTGWSGYESVEFIVK